MTVLLIAYMATAVIFLAIDALWLGLVATSLYRTQIGHLMADDISFVAAGGFYLFFVAGIVYFAVAPALASGQWTTAALNGAVLGLLAYGTYDMTNLATLRDWPVFVSIVDMLWGTALTAAAASGGFFATRYLTG